MYIHLHARRADTHMYVCMRLCVCVYSYITFHGGVMTKGRFTREVQACEIRRPGLFDEGDDDSRENWSACPWFAGLNHAPSPLPNRSMATHNFSERSGNQTATRCKLSFLHTLYTTYIPTYTYIHTYMHAYMLTHAANTNTHTHTSSRHNLLTITPISPPLSVFSLPSPSPPLLVSSSSPRARQNHLHEAVRSWYSSFLPSPPFPSPSLPLPSPSLPPLPLFHPLSYVFLPSFLDTFLSFFPSSLPLFPL